MFNFEHDITFYTVRAENRQFEEAIAFINEVLKLRFNGCISPEKRLLKVQIAGTNGKGSTAAMLAEILKRAGYRTGLYVSPSLVCVNERVRINGEMISDADLIKYIPVISKAQENTGRLFGGFERITAAAMLYYLDNDVDIAVMETGLGGRYDTVSAVGKLILASITCIGMDHMKMLGNTIEQIAWEKSGIMRQGVPCVIHKPVESAVRDVIYSCANELNAGVTETDECTVLSAEVCEGGQRMRASVRGEEYNIYIPLCGEYQRENAKNALLCALKLRDMGYKITKDDIEKGFAATQWEGRLQKVSIDGIKSPVILDGGHNPHAMTAVADYITSVTDKKFVALISVMADKDIRHVLMQARRFVKKAVCVSVTARSCEPEKLAELANECGIDAVYADSVDEGLHIADSLSDGETFYAIGSLYLVGKVLEKIKGR